jgi:hypothetical protein
VDYNDNELRLEILQSKVPRPCIIADYEVIDFKVPLELFKLGLCVNYVEKPVKCCTTEYFRHSASERKIKELAWKIDKQLRHEKKIVRENSIQIAYLEKKIAFISVS